MSRRRDGEGERRPSGRRVAHLIGNPTPRKPIKVPPFVTDTLFPVVGGPFKIVRSHGFSPLGPNNEAITAAGNGDTTVTFYKEPTDHVLAHEAGHILAWSAPRLSDQRI